MGESKSAILANLDRVPEFILVSKALPRTRRIRAAIDFMTERGLSFPVVLKPDVGERGAGVAIVRSDGELASYFAVAGADTIVQKYVGGMEFGIFYYRLPGQAKGQIFSITEKRFPAVVGDGSSTIAELILRDERAVCLSSLYLARIKRSAEDIPAPGESVSLAELGSHCRGAVFLNGAMLETAALRSAVDSVARKFSGFYFGRFDVRSESVEQLQRGQFEVLELNGVSAEATHIYDPSVTLRGAYRALFQQWRLAFEIGALNRQRGQQPMTLREFAALLRTRVGTTSSGPGGGSGEGSVHQGCDWPSTMQHQSMPRSMRG